MSMNPLFNPPFGHKTSFGGSTTKKSDKMLPAKKQELRQTIGTVMNMHYSDYFIYDRAGKLFTTFL